MECDGLENRSFLRQSANRIHGSITHHQEREGEKKMSSTPIYEFQFGVKLTEVKKGGSETKSLFTTNVIKFAILGGAKRTIRKGGEKGIGDADVMSEFYQAKQFHNLILTKELDIDTFTYYKIYDKKISFELYFAIRSLDMESRFRFLQLKSNKAQIIKPPSTDDEGETLNIKYANPEVVYLYTSSTGLGREKL
jgi:hypothetical protein